MQETTRELDPLSCGNPQAQREMRYNAMLVVTVHEDSLADTTFRFAENEMFTANDQNFSRTNLEKYFIENISYPEILKEELIQGQWFYSITFEDGLLASFRLLRSVENSAAMEHEIERCIKKLFNSLHYAKAGRSMLVLRFRVKLVN